MPRMTSDMSRGHGLQKASSQAEHRASEILGSSKIIRHTKVEILRLKSSFLRKKETKLHSNL